MEEYASKLSGPPHPAAPQALPGFVLAHLHHPSSFDLMPACGGCSSALTFNWGRGGGHALANEAENSEVTETATLVREGNPTLYPHFASGRVLPPWLADLAFCRMIELTRCPLMTT